VERPKIKQGWLSFHHEGFVVGSVPQLSACCRPSLSDPNRDLIKVVQPPKNAIRYLAKLKLSKYLIHWLDTSVWPFLWCMMNSKRLDGFWSVQEMQWTNN